MQRAGRLLGLTLLLLAVALPAWANNPPRPDGVLYLLLVFPVALVARYLAGVEAPKRRPPDRIVRAVCFTFVVLFSAIGSAFGLIAMLIVVGYGLTRTVEILRGGEGSKRLALASLVAVSTLAGGAAYLSALGTASKEMIDRARQLRTVAEIRNTGSAATRWLLDQTVTAEAAGASGGDDETATAMTDLDVPEEPEERIAFDGASTPPRISHAELKRLLVPRYTSDLPELDGWQHPYELRLDRQRRRIWIRSGGRDGAFDSGPYVKGPFEPKELDRDIVWADGGLWRWPGPP